MTTDQINRLAAEYAEWYAPEKDYTEFPDMRETDMCIARDEMKQCLKWLLKDHLIAEKRKVMEMYKDSDSAKYDKDYMMSQNARAECNILEALFPETFNPTEK